MIFATIFGVIMLLSGFLVFATAQGTLNQIFASLLCGQGMLIAIISFGLGRIIAILSRPTDSAGANGRR